MKTLLLFENHPPELEDAFKAASVAVRRGGGIVCLCCLPIHCEAYDVAECWHEPMETIKKTALANSLEVEVLFRFYEARRALPERLGAGDIDLVIALQGGGNGNGSSVRPVFQWNRRKEAPCQCALLQIPRAALKEGKNK
ncbi:MAG TPA: hypothetical protein DCL69_10800 [Firmicutes bacterium]|nr:hypothetical protein [Bacillota bacterium]